MTKTIPVKDVELTIRIRRTHNELYYRGLVFESLRAPNIRAKGVSYTTNFEVHGMGWWSVSPAVIPRVSS